MKRPSVQLLRTRLQVFGLAVLITACAGQEVKPPSKQDLDEASLTILRQSIYTNALLEQCSAVGPELAQQAEDLRQRWMAENADYLAAADVHYSRMLANETIDYQGTSLALPAIQLAHRQERRATEELKLDRRTLTNQRIFCERRLQEMAETPAEIFPEADERRQQVLQSLVSSSPGGRAVLATAPTLAAHIELNQDPGRSYFEQLDLLQQECPDPNLTVIDNNWPHEAYGVYCEGVPIAFIECEWGECQHR